MATIFNFQSESGKQQGILSIYILHTLQKNPKSGYSILKELTEKTKGSWTPSKGTIYPLLTKLLTEEFIKIKTIEKRSKTIYEITKKGLKELNQLKKHVSEMEEKITQFRSILADIIGEERSYIITTMIEIRRLSMKLSKTQPKQVQHLLDQLISNLQIMETNT
ncbi:MAG: PadR family transcriptional regulator [Thermoplasmatota archaeon]